MITNEINPDHEKKFSVHVIDDQENENMLKLERSLSRKNKKFVLDGVRNTSKLREYNALKDRHLQGFFYSNGIRRHLLHIGLITRDGYIIEDKRPKIHENYQILPVDNNLYEEKTKETQKKQEKINNNGNNLANRSKSTKTMNNNRVIIQNKPKNYAKLPLINANQAYNNDSERKNNENFIENENTKKEENNDKKQKNMPKSHQIMKPLKPLLNEANKRNSKEEVKPLSKQDLNKWFAQCITKIEKDPDVGLTQKEKLNKTKENLLKIESYKSSEKL